MVNPDDENEGHLVIEMEEKSADEYIFKLPPTLRGQDDGGDDFTPEVLSIGPLHHGLPKYKKMEKKKMEYKSICLDYNPNITSADVFRSLKGLEERVRRTYNQNHFSKTFSSDEFVNMMLLDSCFIIQLFLYKWNGREVAAKYDREMFETSFLYERVQRDLRLVENQLPFFLLVHLFNLIVTDEQRGSLSFVDLAKNNFKRYEKLGGRVLQKSDLAGCKHFGELLLFCFLPSARPKEHSDRPHGYLPTATELRKMGIEIKKSESRNLLDITFSNGVLKIPKIRITSTVRSTFRNIIAMEHRQNDQGYGWYLTDYAQFLDYLVDTKEDVALLKTCQVIDSYGANDKAVAEIFETMTKGVPKGSTKYSYYYDVVHDIHVYRKKTCNKLKASARRDYFNSPIKVVSLSAAAIGLILTVIATVFTVLSFVNK